MTIKNAKGIRDYMSSIDICVGTQLFELAEYLWSVAAAVARRVGGQYLRDREANSDTSMAGGAGIVRRVRGRIVRSVTILIRRFFRYSASSNSLFLCMS